MDIRQVIGRATKEGIKHYGDSAAEKFYSFLQNREFKIPKCQSCGAIQFPPRRFCPLCYSENLVWVDVPKSGRIYSFTNQKRALRFTYPDVIGFVEIEGVGRILTKIEGEDLKIGDKVELDFVEVDGGIILHKFVKRE